MRKDNKGFSLVELIIVIIVMAVLIGALLPQFIKYVGRSRRAVDVSNADEYAKSCDIAHIYNELSGLPGYYVDASGDGWCSWGPGDVAYVNTSNPSTFLDYIVVDLGLLPVSRTDKDLYWVMKYDGQTTKVEGIYLTEPTNLSNPPGSTWQQYELWPDGDEFVKNGP